MLRRDFLKVTSLAIAASPLITPSDLWAQSPNAKNQHVPTVLWAKRKGQELHVDFSTATGYNAIAWLLRDVHENRVGRPDWRLLQLMAWMQAWLGAYGYHACFDLHSGLRMPKTNKRIEGAAQASYHLPDETMGFRASDFSTKSIPSSYMGRLAQYAAQGGVGFYPNDNFTHIDTGPLISQKTGRIRSWVDYGK